MARIYNVGDRLRGVALHTMMFVASSSASHSGGTKVPDVDAQIREIIDHETRAWDTKDVDPRLSVLHEDMVWPWPRHPAAKFYTLTGRG